MKKSKVIVILHNDVVNYHILHYQTVAEDIILHNEDQEYDILHNKRL